MATKIQKRTAASGQVYAYYIEELGKYCAYQILSANKEGICYVALNYLEPELPTLEILADLQPYYRQSFNFNHQMVKSNIDNTAVPKSYIYIGECELKSEPRSNTFSGGWPNGRDYCYEELWKSFSKEIRDTYKKYRNSGDFVTIRGKQFKKNLTWMQNSLYEWLTEADSLKDFPCISEARVNGFTTKLDKFLKETPMLRTLWLWEAGVEVLDLSNTHLQRLTLDMTGIKRLILPQRLDYLKLQGQIDSELVIDDSLCRWKFDMRIDLGQSEVSGYGLTPEKVRSVAYEDVRQLDMAAVAEAFPKLKELLLIGKPGIVTNMQALVGLQQLEGLYVVDMFGYTAQELEAWKALENLCELEMDSIPKVAGTYLKKCWKGKLDVLKIKRLRDENWLKENLQNPLRHWDGNEFIPQGAYKTAIKCYKETKKQLQEATTREQLENIAREYTKCFNKLNDKYEDFIETEERDDIFLVMKQLYEEYVASGVGGSLITLEELWDAMDEVRGDW